MARKTNNVGLPQKPRFNPLSDNQRQAYDRWKDGKNLMLLGAAGSGKTYLALNFALEELESGQSLVRKVIIVRSAVTVRDIGYLPGSAKEKMRQYELPYISIVNDIYGRGDAYDIMRNKGKVEFSPTSFLRGLTFDNSIIIVDECQNLSPNELHTIVTRVGENTKIIFCGDTKQDDLTSERYKEVSGLRNFAKIIDKIDDFSTITFTHEDIVRSGFVKEYIIAKEMFEVENYYK